MLKLLSSSLPRAAPALKTWYLSQPPSLFDTGSASSYATWKLKPFTQADDELIVRLRREGKSSRAIAEEIGDHSTRSVRRRLWHLSPQPSNPHSKPGRKRVPAQSPYTIDEDKTIQQARAQGKTFRTIGYELGRNPDSVISRYSRKLRDNSSTLSQPASKHYSREEDDLILERRLSGETFRDIAAELGRSEAAVAEHFRYFLSLRDSRASSAHVSAWTQEEDQQLLLLKASGQPLYEIAASLERTYGAVRTRYLRSSGPQHPRKGTWTAEERDMLFKLRDDDQLPWSRIAERMNRSQINLQSTFHTMRKALGLESRSNSRYTASEDEMIQQLREGSHLTWSQIAGHMHWRSQISLKCRYNVHLRRR